MTQKMHLVMVTIADLHIGDLLLLPEALVTEPTTVEVTTLMTRKRAQRTSVWVRSMHPGRTLNRPWLYGSFDPSTPIQRMEFTPTEKAVF